MCLVFLFLVNFNCKSNLKNIYFYCIIYMYNLFFIEKLWSKNNLYNLILFEFGNYFFFIIIEVLVYVILKLIVFVKECNI